MRLYNSTLLSLAGCRVRPVAGFFWFELDKNGRRPGAASRKSLLYKGLRRLQNFSSFFLFFLMLGVVFGR